MKKRKKSNRHFEKQLYYGLLLLAAIFVVAGLTTSIKGKNEKQMVWQSREDIENEDAKSESKDIKKKNDADKKTTVAEAKKIRVLILTDGFLHETHAKVEISSDSGMKVTYKNCEKTYKKGKKITITPDHAWLKKGKIRIQAIKGKLRVNNLRRGDGTPSYDGILELQSTAEGIVMVNELPVEEYLCGVVPSEMPTSYELEALKAQAVCARSYAYRQMENYAYPEYKAHVNDSTDYQVYNNSAQAESSSKAVKETTGETVRYRGKVVSTYYYSTSCGVTTNMEAWGTKPTNSNGYLKSVKVRGKNGDYEKNLPWYRWKAIIPVKQLSELIELNTGKTIGTLKKIEVTKRGPGDVAIEMKATGSHGNVTVETENKIRRALGGSGYEIEKQDGSKVASMTLLPSAFFEISMKDGKVVIEGGGFGHGIGMSQTGANEMAKQGKNYNEILSLFYHDITIE